MRVPSMSKKNAFIAPAYPANYSMALTKTLPRDRALVLLGPGSLHRYFHAPFERTGEGRLDVFVLLQGCL